ncbi:hypothetical protein PSTG_15785 [Puccinia striiformis f. sp. tritici PST-78]|uniref:Uncharacterized protein n=1 Tax=Puccinia striiformis f. sp. tritici PST-78 TaxID=1165861 RepID=A0A0L0UUR7_9BASI|nr:hypothetical protein PSTG_15785 [Puccinia striiformis f. sp. tritici PST-78]
MPVATVCEGECQVASIPFQASNPVTDVLQTTRQGLSDNDILSLISSPMSAPEVDSFRSLKFVSQGMIPSIGSTLPASEGAAVPPKSSDVSNQAGSVTPGRPTTVSTIPVRSHGGSKPSFRLKRKTLSFERLF